MLTGIVVRNDGIHNDLFPKFLLFTASRFPLPDRIVLRPYIAAFGFPNSGDYPHSILISWHGIGIQFSDLFSFIFLFFLIPNQPSIPMLIRVSPSLPR